MLASREDMSLHPEHTPALQPSAQRRAMASLPISPKELSQKATSNMSHQTRLSHILLLHCQFIEITYAVPFHQHQLTEVDTAVCLSPICHLTLSHFLLVSSTQRSWEPLPQSQQAYQYRGKAGQTSIASNTDLGGSVLSLFLQRKGRKESVSRKRSCDAAF